VTEGHRRDGSSAASLAYRRYVLGTLTLVYTLNYLDRGLVVLLLQPIKEDLHLSDTQIGFLTGIAFGLFYATLGLPIARWADRGNRVNITALAIGLWGATVMLCLFVGNFFQLVCARIAAAVGEAGCMPPTYSLVGDYFPRAIERTRALAIYMLAGPLSSLISFAVGGRLNELLGWRRTFFVMGMPGLLVALLVKFTIAEPRSQRGYERGAHRRIPRMVEILRTLWGQTSSRHLSIAIILLFVMGFGLGPWYAAFMMRSHGMTTPEVGGWFGLIFGLSGTAGILFGGHAAGRWLAHDDKAQMRMSGVAVAATFPCLILFLLLSNKYQALLALSMLILVVNFITGPIFALMQRLVADDMRATTLSTVMLLANLIGMGIAPWIVGVLSDHWIPVAGNDSLRYAMLTMSLVGLWSGYHFWQVGTTVARDLATVAQSNPVTIQA
jgi:MFS family permease